MSFWLKWLVLTAITGSPLLSAVILIALGWVADHYTLGLLPNPVRPLARWRRELELGRILHHNPHDRRARVELADLLIGRGRYERALGLLRENVQAGDEDTNTLFLTGLACLGAGHSTQGELLLDELDKLATGYRMHAADLERGRWRLKRQDAPGAISALEAFCKASPGSVEGKVLLARAYALQGDSTRAERLRADAWLDFKAAPRFQRRRERLWAWRAKPSRPVLYAALLALFLAAGAVFVAPAVERLSVHAPYARSPYPGLRRPRSTSAGDP